MIGLRQRGRPVFILMIALALLIAFPIHAALAALVDTEAAADSVVRGSDARARLNHYLARGDVQAALRAQGIDPLEAEARVASLTDAEIDQLASRLDELPAGGVLGFVILVLVIVLLVFLILKVAK
jgi:HAMP domain-containing protein